MKGLAVDLMIWNEDHAGYRQQLHERIMDLVAAGVQANPDERDAGGVDEEAAKARSEKRDEAGEDLQGAPAAVRARASRLSQSIVLRCLTI